STFFLRRAWEEVNGLNAKLHYVMDWDVIIRIAKNYPVVTINEFLGVSREYRETKTSTGKMTRIAEIFDMIRQHTHEEMKAVTLWFALATVLNLESSGDLGYERARIWGGMQHLLGYWYQLNGEGIAGFPTESDPQDTAYIPLARNGMDDIVHHRPIPS